jgi:hypothetical protein
MPAFFVDCWHQKVGDRGPVKSLPATAFSANTPSSLVVRALIYLNVQPNGSHAPWDAGLTRQLREQHNVQIDCRYGLRLIGYNIGARDDACAASSA